MLDGNSNCRWQWFPFLRSVASGPEKPLLAGQVLIKGYIFFQCAFESAAIFFTAAGKYMKNRD